MPDLFPLPFEDASDEAIEDCIAIFEEWISGLRAELARRRDHAPEPPKAVSTSSRGCACSGKGGGEVTDDR